MQKRDAKRYILDLSFHDNILAESVCTVTITMIKNQLKLKYDGVFPEAWDVERGEIIIDSRGRGTFQGE